MTTDKSINYIFSSMLKRTSLHLVHTLQVCKFVWLTFHIYSYEKWVPFLLLSITWVSIGSLKKKNRLLFWWTALKLHKLLLKSLNGREYKTKNHGLRQNKWWSNYGNYPFESTKWRKRLEKLLHFSFCWGPTILANSGFIWNTIQNYIWCQLTLIL